MSLQSSSEFWNGVTFWLIGVGTLLLFVSVVTGIVARRYGRRLSEEKSQQAERDKRTYDQAIAKLAKETAEANARAAEANRKAETERKERLAIEKDVIRRFGNWR